MGDNTYIYGDSNGSSYLDLEADTDLPRKTHWDPRLDIRAIAGTVQIGVVPPKRDSSGSQVDPPVWDNEDGQFLSLSREGCNRLIEAVRQFRNEVYGADQ